MATLITKKGEKSIKIVKSHILKENQNEKNPAKIGETLSLDGGIAVKTRYGAIVFDEIIPEGKNKMTAAEFILGRGVNIGDMWK